MIGVKIKKCFLLHALPILLQRVILRERLLRRLDPGVFAAGFLGNPTVSNARSSGGRFSPDISTDYVDNFMWFQTGRS